MVGKCRSCVGCLPIDKAHACTRACCYDTYIGAVTCTACPAGLYGAFCAEKCDCASESTCDPVYGQCHCQPGYMGPRCDTGDH